MEQQHWTLIIKQIVGEISTEESQVLDTWISESSDNKLQFEKATKLLKTTENSFETFDPNTHEEWEMFKAKINTKQNSTIVVPLWKKQWVRVAASIILLIGFGYLANLTLNSVETIELVAINNIKVVHLPDGSSVTLNQNSNLTYTENFEGSERRVILIGEGYFEVIENPTRPFIVVAGNTETKVLGTAFNLKAYDDEVELIVTKGKVKFSANETELVLIKYDKVIYNEKTKTHKQSKSNELDLKWLLNDAKKLENKMEKGVKKTLKNLKKDLQKQKKN